MESSATEDIDSSSTEVDTISDGDVEQDSPMMVDINTGMEHRNESVSESSTCLKEIIIFKIRHNTVTQPEVRCTSDDCFCDQDEVKKTIKKLISAVKTVADCRTRMCAFTQTGLETHKDFRINFDWIELGEELDDEDNVSSTNRINSNTNVSTSGESSCISLPSTQANDEASQKFSDTSVLTRGSVQSSAHSTQEGTERIDALSSQIEHPLSRKSRRKKPKPVVKVALVLKTPEENGLPMQDANDEKEEESSNSHENLSSSYDIIYNCNGNSETNEKTETSVSSTREVVCSENEKESLVHPKNLQIIDEDEDTDDLKDHEDHDNDKNDDKGDTCNSNSSGVAQEPDSESVTLTSNLAALDPEEDGLIFENGPHQILMSDSVPKKKFERGTGCARCMPMVKCKYSPNVNIIRYPETINDNESGELEKGDSNKNPTVTNATDILNQTSKPVSTSVPEQKLSEKRSEKQSTEVVTAAKTKDAGVTTRSRSNRPAPASVRRNRAERRAKQNAQAKISSSFVLPSSSGSETSSPAKSVPGGPSNQGLTKRLRSSETLANDNQLSADLEHPVNKKPKGNDSFKRNDGSPSRSSTPILGQPSQLEPKNTPCQNSDSVLTSTSSHEDPMSDITETMSEPEAKPVEDMEQNSDDSSSSDSGESQVSGISEVPLKERLERKKKRKLQKQHKTALKRKMSGSGYLSDTPSYQSEVPYLTRMKNRKKKRRLLLNKIANVGTGQPEFKIPPSGSIMKRAREELQKIMALQTKLKADKLRDSSPTKMTPDDTSNNDDEIQMIEEIPCPSGKRATTGGDSQLRECQNKSNQSSIHITFNKEKTKSILQRSNSFESPVEETCKESIADNNPKTSLSSIQSAAGIAASNATTTSTVTLSTTASSGENLDLDDCGNSWEINGGISSNRKAQIIGRGIVKTPPTPAQHTNAFTTAPLPPKEKSSDHSKLDTPQDPPVKLTEKPKCTSISGLPSDEGKISTVSKTAESPIKDPSSDPVCRPLRVRKQSLFDPKMEAIKIKPKPVPKVTKETLQQQQSVSSKIPEKETDKESTGGQVNPSEAAGTSRGVLPTSSNQKADNCNNSHASKSTNERNNEEDDDILILSPSPTKEKTQSLPQSQPVIQKAQSDTPKEKTNESDDIALRRSNRESSSPYNSPQKSNTGPKNGGEKSKPETVLTCVDGEIRMMPKPSSSGGSSTATSRGSGATSTSSAGTWRRGGAGTPRRDPDVIPVNFANRPGEEGRRGNNRNGRNCNRGGGNHDGYRGNRHQRGGHQPQYGNSSYGGYFPRPPHHGSGNHFDGSRPPFRGPPPRGNTISTVTSRRSNQHFWHPERMTNPHPFPHRAPPGWGWF